MIYEYDLLPPEVVKNLLDFYDFTNFRDGNMAGSKNKGVKYNLEMVIDKNWNDFSSLVLSHVWSKWEFKEILGIRKTSGVIFSKYEEGMHYDYHNDHYNLDKIRTDHSATCFLSHPDEYEGGELEILVGNQPLTFKLHPGKVIVYPTGLRHRVKKVTKGTRKVAVFWMESCIQDPGIRDINTRLGEVWYKYKDKLLDDMPEVYDAILNAKFQLQRQFGNYEGL